MSLRESSDEGLVIPTDIRVEWIQDRRELPDFDTRDRKKEEELLSKMIRKGKVLLVAHGTCQQVDGRSAEEYVGALTARKKGEILEIQHMMSPTFIDPYPVWSQLVLFTKEIRKVLNLKCVEGSFDFDDEDLCEIFSDCGFAHLENPAKDYLVALYVPLLKGKPW